MAEPLPKFDAPPVVETALSVQFARLPNYLTAHAGWFWKSYLAKLAGGEAWVKAAETPRLEDQFERLGEDDWGRPGFRMVGGAESQRTQIIREDEQRMIQVQDSRFVLNWKKRSGGYPSYDSLWQEFPRPFEAFQQFARDAGFGSLELNQWEMTYVNHIPKGELWTDPGDWRGILPNLTFPKSPTDLTALETLGSDWRFRIRERGRLYIALRHAKVQPEEEVMQLILTARGPISKESGWTLEQGFELGHEAIVRSFAEMTSAAAHKSWKRRA